MRHAQDDDLITLREGDAGLDTVDDEGEMLGLREGLSYRGNVSGSGMAMRIQASDGIKDVSPHLGRCGGVSRLKPFDDAEKVGAGRFGPADRGHELGVMSRLEAATTVS